MTNKIALYNINNKQSVIDFDNFLTLLCLISWFTTNNIKNIKSN